MDFSWDDLRLFLVVARLGGLSAARQSTGLSAATLGRRITALEHDVGEALFERSQTGYSLTPTGRELLAHAEEAEAAMREIARWREGSSGGQVVRISAGAWTSEFLASNIDAIWHPGDGVRIEFLTANRQVDIGRRAADIGIRNARPTGAALAGRRVGQVAFALFRSGVSREQSDQAGRFVAFSGESANVPSARWLMAHHGEGVVMHGNSQHGVRELVASGVGTGVLPCFIGDRDARLVRAGPTIAELTSEQWLVTHHEERHRRPVRETVNRIAALLRENMALFAGEMGSEKA